MLSLVSQKRKEQQKFPSYDQKHKMLCMNPGAAGISGFHKMRTMLRFALQEGDIQQLEVIELGPRGSSPPMQPGTTEI